MAKELEVEFKTLLTKSEYTKLAAMFADKPSNTQVNYYFDTPRFTLKASDIGLRVRQRDTYELTLKRKKGYALIEINETLSEEDFQTFLKTGVIPSQSINNDLSEIIKGQNIINYMSLSTYRITFPYKNGIIALDKCEYVNKVDYELEYHTSQYEDGKKTFIELIKTNNLVYKKSQPKIKRAYDALKRNY